MYWNAHLVAMCDRSGGGGGGANDGLPEASSIRPGLAGLPARATEEAMPVGARLRRCCVSANVGQRGEGACSAAAWSGSGKLRFCELSYHTVSRSLLLNITVRTD